MFSFHLRYITEELKKIDGIFIVGKPQVSVVAIGYLIRLIVIINFNTTGVNTYTVMY